LLFDPPAQFDGKQTTSQETRVLDFQEGLNRVTLDAEASIPSILLVSQTFYPGWEAYVDNQPAAIFRADYTLTGLALASGRHHVELRFRPASVRIGIAITGMTVSGILTGALVSARRRRRFRRSAPWLAPVPALLGFAGVVMAVSMSRNTPAESHQTDVRAATSLAVDSTLMSVHFKNPAGVVTATTRAETESGAIGGLATVAYSDTAEWVTSASRPGTAFVFPIELNRKL